MTMTYEEAFELLNRANASNVSNDAFRVLAVLLLEFSAQGRSMPTLDILANLTHRSMEDAESQIYELIEKGWFERAGIEWRLPS